MTKNHTGICIVWPAHFEGSTDPELHVTALFLGKTGGRFAKANPTFRESLLKFLGSISQDPGPVGVEKYGYVGYRQDVPALMIGYQQELADQYAYMHEALKSGGVPIDETYAFSPHVTLKNEANPSVLPKTVHLEAPVLWWGNSRPVHSKHQIEAPV